MFCEEHRIGKVTFEEKNAGNIWHWIIEVRLGGDVKMWTI